MGQLTDDEFGIITVRKVSRSSTLRVTVAPNGSLRITVPSLMPQFMIKRTIHSMRDDIRELLAHRSTVSIADGQTIGKGHVMIVRSGASTAVRISGSQLIVTLGAESTANDTDVLAMVRTKILAILRKEAKQHLPRRIRHIADQHGLDFSSLRFTHASTRWGSCNSNKAISLNIALMNLPFDLIDYVLMHELAHTVHMNHSDRFWAQVESMDPDYRIHRKALKSHNPSV